MFLVNLGASVVPNFISRAIAVCSWFPVFVHLLPGKAANPCPGLVCHAGIVEDEEEEVARLNHPNPLALSPLLSSGSLDRLGLDDR